VDKLKATGEITVTKKSIYPEEIVKADKIVGKAWIKSKQKYIDTDVFRIVYSKNGTHVYPLNPRKAEE